MSWSTYGIDGQRKYLTRSETERFLLHAQKEHLSVYTFCWFVAATGCRISEALMITAKSIDFEAGLVIVECLKKRRRFVYRAVPLPATLLKMLEKLARDDGSRDGEKLWPWSRMTGYRRITEVMEKANIAGPWATPKGLRHAFGVRAVHSGAPLHMVQRWLGHADMTTTAIYAGAVGPEERDIASRTWLRQDEKAEPLNSFPDQGICESDRQVEWPLALLPEIETIIESKKSADKPWLSRLFSNTAMFHSCQMIHFYLFCRKYFY